MSNTHKQQGLSSNDAKTISMRLQSLLQIPAIDKVECPDNIQSGSSASKIVGHLPVESQPTQGVNLFDKHPQQVMRLGKENVFFGGQNFEFIDDGNSSHNTRSVTKSTEAVDYLENCVDQEVNENTPVKLFKGSQSNAPRRLMELNTPLMGSEVSVNSSNVKIVNTNYSRILALVSSLCEKQECPQDVEDNIQSFVRAILECEESSNTQMNYFIALDTKVKTILSGHFIDTLNKKSFKFPRAKFYCNACNYHMDSISSAIQHLSQPRHYLQEKSRRVDFTAMHIPVASKEHSDAIAELIFKITNRHGLGPSRKLERLTVLNIVRNAIEKAGIECTVSMFGSSVSGLGLYDSDLNINVSFGNELNSELSSTFTGDFPVSPRTPTASVDNSLHISKIAEVLEKIEDFCYIKENYNAKKATISFTSYENQVNCVIQFNNSPAVLLACLFDEYCKIDPRVWPLVVTFRYFARICEIDNQENGLLPPHCYTIMVIHYLQEAGIVPVLHCIPKLDQSRPFATAKEALKGGWTCSSTTNYDIGRLWINLLGYYALHFDYKDRVVTISRSEALRRTEKSWNRKLSIEDPIVPNSNVARSATSNRICDYIIDRIKVAYLHFGIPQTRNGPIYDGIVEDESVDNSAVFIRTIQCTAPIGIEATVPRQIQICDVPLNSMSNVNPPVQSDCTIIRVKMTKQRSDDGRSQSLVLNNNAVMLHCFLRKSEFDFEFTANSFWNGTPPPSVCKACGSERHIRKDCPEETIPALKNVANPSQMSLDRLRATIMTNFDREILSTDDHHIRIRISCELHSLLGVIFPDVRLILFGSSQNGFGLRNSDVDICMTFQRLNVPQGENPLKFIEVNGVLMQVVNSLKQSGRFVDVLPITSAKVPIVKFRHKDYKLEGDISLYNILALHNTALLKVYTSLDSRVRTLGCFLKKLGKMCDISDASKGSLSSYGYILMLIHYLQQLEVPVLPVLQEMAPMNHHPGDPLPMRLVDGWNTYFFEDINGLREVWPSFQKNKDSTEELWLGFLCYYTENFNYDENVITISQSGPLTRKSKSWYTDAIAIEDPFDKSHNLGAGLSRRMSVHIIKTFHRFREVFHSRVDNLTFSEVFNFYLDSNKLRGGNPPIDRQCRLCYRIGHFARNCTYVGKQEQESTEHHEDDEAISRNMNLSPMMSEASTVEFAKPIHQIPFTNDSVTQPNSFEPMVNFDGARMYPCAPMSIRIPFNSGGFVPPPPMFAPQLAFHSYNMPKPVMSLQATKETNRVLDGYTFFWNVNDDSPVYTDKMLLSMVKKSAGIRFSEYLINKAERVKQSSDIPVPIQPENIFSHGKCISSYQHGPSLVQTNGQIPPVLYRAHETPVLCSSSQANRIAYPILNKDTTGIPPPPPGFAPLTSQLVFPHPQLTVAHTNALARPSVGSNLSGNVMNDMNGQTGRRELINQWQFPHNRRADGTIESHSMTFHNSNIVSQSYLNLTTQVEGDNVKSGGRHQSLVNSGGQVSGGVLKSNLERNVASAGGYVSQIHYAPVVSALQIQRAQNHPSFHLGMSPSLQTLTGSDQRPPPVEINQVLPRPPVSVVAAADNISHPPGFGTVHQYEGRRY